MPVAESRGIHRHIRKAIAMRTAFVILLFVLVQQLGAGQTKVSAASYKIESGKILVTTDEGRSWAETPAALRDVSLLAWNSTQKPYFLVAASGGQLYHICGECKHWDVALNVSPYFVPQKLIVSPTNPQEVWVSGSDQVRDRQGSMVTVTRIFCSFDGGVVWTSAMVSGQPIKSLHLDPADNRKAWFIPERHILEGMKQP